jgi:hypothetical protein
MKPANKIAQIIQKRITNYQLPLPITHYPLPITHYLLPIPHYQFPITNSPLPIPNYAAIISPNF